MTSAWAVHTLAELLERLGGISPERVRVDPPLPDVAFLSWSRMPGGRVAEESVPAFAWSGSSTSAAVA